MLQLDEPSLPAVLAARIPTSSGFGTLRAPQPALALEHLAVEAARQPQARRRVARLDLEGRTQIIDESLQQTLDDGPAPRLQELRAAEDERELVGKPGDGWYSDL